MKNLFFYKLYVFDKRLFFLLAIFSILTVVCNIRGDEISPFFIWAMYSEKERPVNRYEIFKIQVNDSVLVDYTSGRTDNTRFFLSSPLAYYHKIQQNSQKDPSLTFLQEKLGAKYSMIKPLAEKINNGAEEQLMFIDWYKRYLQRVTGWQIHTLQVEVLTGHFNQKNQIQIDSSYLLAAWKQR